MIGSHDLDKAVKALEAGHVRKTMGAPITRAVRLSGNLVRKNVRATSRAHKRSGHMARNRMTLKFTGRGLDTVVKFSALSPANLIVGGVKPHHEGKGKVMPITTGSGKFRGGSGEGVTGFATAVEHPGFAADPFVRHGIDQSIPAIKGFLDTAGKQIVDDLAASIRGGI